MSNARHPEWHRKWLQLMGLAMMVMGRLSVLLEIQAKGRTRKASRTQASKQPEPISKEHEERNEQERPREKDSVSVPWVVNFGPGEKNSLYAGNELHPDELQ